MLAIFGRALELREETVSISPKTALKLLEGKRIEVSALGEISREGPVIISLDQQTVPHLPSLTPRQDQAIAQEAERRMAMELLRIEQAFERMENGDFGYCVECDEKIPLQRLESDPAATHCSKCASLLEKKKN